MKNLLLVSLFAASVQLAVAQDIKKVESNFLLNRVEDAKTEIDKVIADPKNGTKPEALYWKAKVYAATYKDLKLSEKFPGIEQDAQDAIQKYMGADPGLAVVKAKGAEPFFDIYSTSFQKGVKLFNEKKWAEAAHSFEISITYIDEIIKNKWTNSSIAFDTTSLLYTGYALQNANKPNEAAKYYGKLADHKVKGEGYVEVYRFLVVHFTNANNEAQFNKYLALAKEVYPKEMPWDEFELDFIDKNYDLAKKTAMYDKEDAAGTLTEKKYLQFGDLFVNVKSKEKGHLDSAQIAGYTLKAVDAFKKAFAKNDKQALAAYNVGIIYYTIFGDYDDQYSSNIRTMRQLNANKPVEKDPKKKAATEAAYKQQVEPLKKANAELEKPISDNIDASIEWLTKSYNILKEKSDRTSVEKSVINKAVDFLANLYSYKRDKTRGKDAKAYDAYDVKYKEFDALHGKF
jgi:hypothetical protein